MYELWNLGNENRLLLVGPTM